MTILDLKDIFERFDVFEQSYTIEPEAIALPSDVGELKEPVKVYIRITKDNKGYKVHLTLEGGVDLECSRCLTTFRKEIVQDTEKHVERYPKEDHLSLSPEDLDVSFMEEPDILVLEDLVREELILGVPMKPLCRPDCPGTGHQAFIFEEEKHADPRFAILKDLLTR